MKVMARMRLTGLGVVVAVVCFASTAAAQAPVAQPAPRVPDFRVEIWGDAVADFSARMTTYAALRARLARGLPVLAVTDDPVEILKAETALAERIRQARAGARRGAIFSRDIRAAFKRAMASELNEGVCESIRDDNPGEFSYRINGTYPKQEPLSTMPPSILAALPRLPDDVMYRFLGRHLVLHDTRANVILDEIHEAIKCK